MKNYELELLEFFKELKKDTIMSFRDFDELKLKLINCSNKISCQRVELETSRDNWKKKYEEVKNENSK